jgi:hypothetical protein
MAGCLLALLAGIWILVAVAGSLPVLSLSRAQLESLDSRQAEDALAMIMVDGIVDSDWASANGFEPAGVFRVNNAVGSPVVVAWARSGERTYLCAYLVGNNAPLVDFVTILDRGGLTTGKSKDGQLLPSSPDSFIQTFTATTAVLWRHHQTGLKVLAAKRNVSPLSGQGFLEEDFTAAMSRQSDYVRSRWLWPLQIPYWFFVRRHVRHEKPVAKWVDRR